MKYTNYIFLSKFKGDTQYSYSFEDGKDAEKHLTDLLFMAGTQVSRKSHNTLVIKIDEDYTIVIVKRTY